MEQSTGLFTQNVASQSGKLGFHPVSGDRCEFLVLWRSVVPFPSLDMPTAALISLQPISVPSGDLSLCQEAIKEPLSK